MRQWICLFPGERINKETMIGILEERNEPIEKLIDHSKISATKERIAKGFKKFSHSYVDTKLSLISSLDNDIQILILEIRDRIYLVNQSVDYYSFLFKKIFDQLSVENYEAIKQNMRNQIDFIANLSTSISDDISTLLKKL
jgi:hypothetical protein